MIQNIAFTKDFDYYTYRFVASPQINSSVYLKFDKYFYKLKTAFSIKNIFSWFANPIEITNQILSSKNFGYNFYTSFRPTINERINLNLGLDYRTNKDIISKKSTYQWNPFIDIMAVATKKFSFGVRGNYFNSNYDANKTDYVFLNTNFWYTIKPNKVDFKLGVNNILNQAAVYSGNRSNIVTQ